MRLRRRPDHDFGEHKDRAEPAACTEHAWRLRDVTFALPGSYISEVCDRCGALQIKGPGESTGMFGEQPGPGRGPQPANPSRSDDASELAVLEELWSRPDAQPPPPPR